MHWERRRLRGSLARCNIIRHAMLNPSVPDDWSYLHILSSRHNLASDYIPSVWCNQSSNISTPFILGHYLVLSDAAMPVPGIMTSSLVL